MLNTLFIENYALVSRLELDFQSGMTVLTGETGAGKSIMIDALMLALGGKTDASVIRPGADKCEINAYFTFDATSEPAVWLQEHDLAASENEVWLRRIITNEGRSKAYINGHPQPLQKMKEISELLVDIHGQHQHQRLLSPEIHRQQLDAFANHTDLMEAVAKHYQACIHLKKQTEALLTTSAHQERMALLNYQIEEIQALNYQPEEIHTLTKEHDLLHHAQHYLAQIAYISEGLQGEKNPICKNLHGMISKMNNLPDNPHVKNALELLQNALIACQEAHDEIQDFERYIELDPERLNAVETRLTEIHGMARKYHVEPNHLPEFLQQLTQEHAQLQSQQQQRIHLATALEESKKSYEQAALLLRQSRLNHADSLAKIITKTIQQLGIPRGEIAIQITPLETPHLHGMDKVEYIVCTNPGLKPDALAKIASGGELSRIALSIQLITAQKKASTPTLIFDEVDVGIGGTTAAIVGQFLRNLGEKMQVFSVTHQPQVAAAGHHHFLVKKHITENNTHSSISYLTLESRIQEIARMLGGKTIQTETLQHAKALLEEHI